MGSALTSILPPSSILNDDFDAIHFGYVGGAWIEAQHDLTVEAGRIRRHLELLDHRSVGTAGFRNDVIVADVLSSFGAEHADIELALTRAAPVGLGEVQPDQIARARRQISCRVDRSGRPPWAPDR